jgi:serine/threonine-protein kinase
MPCLSGATLARWLERGKPLPLAVTLWIIRQIAEALGAVADQGWMHGDVKPANIHVADDGHATLLDLGFVRRVEESKSLADRPMLGTLRYMAPEMITSSLAGDIRSDIYSLGASFYELLSGKPPFPGDDPASLAMMHRDTPAPRLERILPDLPAPVAELVHEMLAKEPLRRPQTPSELVERLTRLEIDYFHARSWPAGTAAQVATPAFAKHRAAVRTG